MRRVVGIIGGVSLAIISTLGFAQSAGAESAGVSTNPAGETPISLEIGGVGVCDPESPGNWGIDWYATTTGRDGSTVVVTVNNGGGTHTKGMLDFGTDGVEFNTEVTPYTLTAASATLEIGFVITPDLEPKFDGVYDTGFTYSPQTLDVRVVKPIDCVAPAAPGIDIAKKVKVAGSGAAFTESTVAVAGEAVEWQIVVTNSGNTDLTGITVADVLVPGCNAAAFDLLSTTSRTISCLSTSLAVGFTNTATVNVGASTGGTKPAAKSDTAAVLVVAAPVTPTPSTPTPSTPTPTVLGTTVLPETGGPVGWLAATAALIVVCGVSIMSMSRTSRRRTVV